MVALMVGKGTETDSDIAGACPASFIFPVFTALSIVTQRQLLMWGCIKWGGRYRCWVYHSSSSRLPLPSSVLLEMIIGVVAGPGVIGPRGSSLLSALLCLLLDTMCVETQSS